MSIQSKTVLIVDDMRMTRMKLRKICTDLGIKNINEAVDGAQALEMLAQGKPDLILSDWNMPNISGIELIQKIRENPAFSTIPVIFITAEAEKNSIIKSLQFGVADYILKPFNDENVKAKICSSLNVAIPE
jgi:two-component system, chemotaxis family, chemotaxis protein CheY